MTRSSSKLTRIMAIAWIKENWQALAITPLVLAAAVIFYLNPTISGKIETALVVHSQQLPAYYQATAMIAFIELPNGRSATITIPVGTAPPAPGSSIRVMHSQHLLLGDSFQFIQ
jgi:hypothetical protein